MDTRTGKIYDPSKYTKEEWDTLANKLGYNLQEVPQHLQSEANDKLKGRRSVRTSLTNGSGLSKFAAKHRKAKRRQQRRSRKNKQ